MATATLTSIDDVLASLTRALGANTMSLGPVVTRVVLRTGVSLKSPRPDQQRDAAAIEKVLAALADMGYQL